MEKQNWNKERVLKMARSRVINYSGATLCDNYRNPLERCKDAAQAIRLYKNCISWALQERYPTKDELLSFTDKETLAENGIYIDTEFNGERIDNHICCVFLNCKGKITTGLNLEKKIIPMLYLSEGSQLEIKIHSGLMDGAVPIELYYGSRVYIPHTMRRYVRITDNNELKGEDNIGFSDEMLSVDPDLTNELL